MLLKDSSVFVTGGASGLGAATARILLEGGAKVLLFDRDEERGQAYAAELGDSAQFHRGDVTSAEDLSAGIAAAVSMAPLRVAVNCAGIAIVKRTINREGVAHELDSYAKVIQVNLIGSFNVLRLAAAQMSKQEPTEAGSRGLIVNTASVAAYDGQIGQVAYASSKGGIVGMTLPAARDLSAVGVRVMTIAPGIFETPMMQGLPDKARAALAQIVPFPKRLGMPEEYGRLVAHFADNEYLNGEVVRLDASLRMPPK